MPIFLDQHDLTDLTAEDITEAHRRDLEVQEPYGVNFLTYWFDPELVSEISGWIESIEAKHRSSVT